VSQRRDVKSVLRGRGCCERGEERWERKRLLGELMKQDYDKRRAATEDG